MKNKKILLINLFFCIWIKAERDPFSFGAAYTSANNVIEKSDENRESLNPDVSAPKKFSAGQQFDQNWTVRSVHDDILFLQNEKGQICEISLQNKR